VKRKTYFSVVIAFAAIVALIVLANPPAAHTDSAFRVDVVNTPNVHVNNSPLPVSQSGSWNVGVNNSSLPVSQSGSWNVGLTGSPSVLVGNPLSSPAFVRNVPDPTTLYQVGGVQVTVNDGFPEDEVGVTLPSNELFVVKFVTVSCTLLRGRSP
jgi:hypothetical protein